MALFAVALIVSLLVVGGIAGFWWWRSRSFDRFFAKVTACLLDLGLVVHRLPDKAARSLAIEAIALFRAKRDFEPKHLAMRYFTLYSVEYTGRDDRAYANKQALFGAMQTMRSWGEQDPSLKDAAEREIAKITRYLHDFIERSSAPKEQRLARQAELLWWAAGKPDFDWRAEIEKAAGAED